MRSWVSFTVFIILAPAVYCQPQIIVQPLSFYDELFQHEIAFDTLTISNPGDDTLEYSIRTEPSGSDQSVRILAWTAYTDIDQEWEHTLEALEMYLTDYDIIETNTISATELQSLLSDRTCFLIPEQESAPDLTNIGQEWRDVLESFLNSGGVIIGLDHTGDVEGLYNGSQLLDIDIIDTSTNDLIVTVLDPSHPFCNEMPVNFSALNGNNWHSSTNGENLIDYGGLNHLTYRNIGSGSIVYWGVDFYEYNDDMALLLCNIASSPGGLSWLDYYPARGFVPPDDESVVIVRMEAGILDPGIYLGIMKIRHNVTGLQEVPIGLTMMVMNELPPEIEVEPDSLSAEVIMNSVEYDQITINNNGEGTLRYISYLTTNNNPPNLDQQLPSIVGENSPQYRSASSDRQNNHGQSPGTDNEYQGQNMMFGITDQYGEIMPFQYPIGNEHLNLGSEVCGYTVTYIDDGEEYLAFSVNDERSNISTGTYEEISVSAEYVEVKTTNITDDNKFEIEQTFKFYGSNTIIIVEAVITNIGGNSVEELYYKICADWDVDEEWDDDDWDYDETRNMSYAYSENYCSITPIEPAPDIIDIDGWNDYNNRETDGNMPPQTPVTDFDGCQLLHYELGDFMPGQSSTIMVVFAAASSLDELQIAVDCAFTGYYGPWIKLSNSIGHVDPFGTGSLGITFISLGLVPETYDAIISIESNDLINPVLEIPVTMTVVPFEIDLTVQPLITPVQIPPSGGQFEFFIEVMNHLNQPLYPDIWWELSDSIPGYPDAKLLRELQPIPPLSGLNDTIRIDVPGGLSPGDYIFYVCGGNFIGDIVCGADSFIITVLNETGTANSDAFDSNLYEYKIGRSFPNPFNAETAIDFSLDEAMRVEVSVYNHLGRLVDRLANNTYEKGKYNICWNAENYSTGIYFILIKTDRSQEIQKVILLK